jgi:rRNA 2'-O-methyltransferase fibrillarin
MAFGGPRGGGRGAPRGGRGAPRGGFGGGGRGGRGLFIIISSFWGNRQA